MVGNNVLEVEPPNLSRRTSNLMLVGGGVLLLDSLVPCFFSAGYFALNIPLGLVLRDKLNANYA